MAFSLQDFTEQVKKLEDLLTVDFQKLSEELRKETSGQANGKIKFRLVEQLQYHDILRQKLEHVRQFGEILIEDRRNSPGKGRVNDFDTLQVELSLALLRYTNMEYQEVSRKTHQLLFTADKNTELIAENPLFGKEIGDLIRNLEKLYLEMESPEGEDDEKEKPARYRKILESFSMKTERDVFSMLFDEEVSDSSEDENDPEGQIELF